MKLSETLPNSYAAMKPAVMFVWKRNIVLAVLGLLLISILPASAQFNVNPCFPYTPISYGQTVNGTLTTRDCVTNNRYSDLYTFSGTQGTQISIAMNKGTLADPFLELLDVTNGDVAPVFVASDDDGGGFPNSLINITLPSTGSYLIRATSLVLPSRSGSKMR